MGHRFGKYELLERIGLGGMAEVFLARRFGAEGFVKQLVIKRILPAYNEDADFVRMFINEARLVSRLQHTNIVQIYDFDHVDGVYYIAMEWVDGTDLKRVITTAQKRSQPIPAGLAIHAGAEALKGLHYAHSRTERAEPLGLVHRDISPHNILISVSGEVKISDFGIAKAAALASITRQGTIKGKLPYMSPEQSSGDPLDARSDIFSLGVVLWELLASRRLYRAETEGQLYGMVRAARVPPLAQVNPELDGDLAAVVMRMLAPSPEARPQSAAEALEALGQFAGVHDALVVERYLHGLLPEFVARGRRGGTQMEPMSRVHQDFAARVSPDAETHTLEPSGAAVTGPVAPGGTGPGSTPAGSVTGPAPPTDRRPGWPLRLGIGALLLLLAAGGGAGGWWLVASRAPTAAAPPAGLEIRTRPAGATVLVDGVELGTSPLKIEAPPGTLVAVTARHGELLAAGSARVGQVPALELELVAAAPARPPDAAAPARPPDAARPEAGPPEAGPPDARAPDSRSSTAKSAPAPVAGEQPARPAGSGTLEIKVYPWANVWIDGRRVGQTPVIRKLPAGEHRVRLHNPELDRRETLKVRIKPGGKKQAVTRDWAP